MDLIYTDANFNDIGVLRDFTLDVDVAGERDFEIKFPISGAVLKVGNFWYLEGTEYGGIVDCIEVNTENEEVTYSGRTWRGLLHTRIVSPPAGADYKIVTGDWSIVAGDLITEAGLEKLFSVDDAGFSVVDWRIDRYVTLLEALEKLLASKDYRINLEWRDGKVRIGAARIRDLTDTIQYETEDRVQLTVKDDRGGVNHLICLGQGQLAAREVVHLYCTATGAITEESKYYSGMDEIVATYVDTAAEDRATLKQAGFERLKELRNKQTFSVKVTDLDPRIGDIVGGVERLTGIRVAEPVKNIIFKIDANGQPSIEYKVGE